MRRFRVILSLILVTFWVPASSHALLESLDLIHEQHAAHDEHSHHGSGTSHEHDSTGHDLADGNCRTETIGLDLPTPSQSLDADGLCATGICGLTSAVTVGLDRPGPSPPGTSPPELFQLWRFSLRAALPIRAPSILS